MMKLSQGDITELAKVDAIVRMQPILEVLGGGWCRWSTFTERPDPRLMEECRKVPKSNGVRCPFGEARITKAGWLNANFVIHTVGPIFRNEEDPEKVLKSAYENCFKLAKEHECQSIAFPAISCGAYGYPIKEAGEIAAFVCNQFTEMDIYFYLFDDDIFSVWNSIDWSQSVQS